MILKFITRNFLDYNIKLAKKKNAKRSIDETKKRKTLQLKHR